VREEVVALFEEKRGKNYQSQGRRGEGQRREEEQVDGSPGGADLHSNMGYTVELKERGGKGKS